MCSMKDLIEKMEQAEQRMRANESDGFDRVVRVGFKVALGMVKDYYEYQAKEPENPPTG